MVGYIDDFGDICRSELLTDSQIAFRTLFRAIGVALKPDEADAGNHVVFRVLRAPSPLRKMDAAPHFFAGREGHQLGNPERRMHSAQLNPTRHAGEANR